LPPLVGALSPSASDPRPGSRDLIRLPRCESIHALEELHIEVTSHWEEGDAVYRYYHGSFKVYSIQDCIKQIVALFQELGDGSKLNGDFPKIIEAAPI
jgi:hypothetical protein